MKGSRKLYDLGFLVSIQDSRLQGIAGHLRTCSKNPEWLNRLSTVQDLREVVAGLNYVIEKLGALRPAK